MFFKSQVLLSVVQGILTTSSHGEYVSTTQDAFRPVTQQVVRQEGERLRLLKEQLYRAVTAQVHEERDREAREIPDLDSTTHHDVTSNGIYCAVYNL